MSHITKDIPVEVLTATLQHEKVTIERYLNIRYGIVTNKIKNVGSSVIMRGI